MTNKTMIQYFEWYLPEKKLHWKRTAAQAAALRASGINVVWLPPAYKGAAGASSVGYDVYDMYDLGEFNQKGSTATKYGSKEDYIEAVKSLQEQGIKVLCDIVLNHPWGQTIRNRSQLWRNLVQTATRISAANSRLLPGQAFRFLAGQTPTPIFAGMLRTSAERTGMNLPSEMAFSALMENVGTTIPTQKMEIMIILWERIWIPTIRKL